MATADRLRHWAQQVRLYARQAQEAREQRDELMAQMDREDALLRDIAHEAGLSIPHTSRIVVRQAADRALPPQTQLGPADVDGAQLVTPLYAGRSGERASASVARFSGGRSTSTGGAPVPNQSKGPDS